MTVQPMAGTPPRSAAGPRTSTGSVRASTVTLIGRSFPRRRCWPAWVAGIPPRSPICIQGRLSWTWGRGRHRRGAQRQAGWAHREGVRLGHDRRDAGVGSGNAAEAGATKVEFLKGLLEAIPLSELAVDVVISNCVINLSTDKRAVMAEMFRVLRPGGRLGISDVVAEDGLSPTERGERGSYVGCIAGALSVLEYEQGLAEAGFAEVTVTFTHQVADGMHGAIVKAIKP